MGGVKARTISEKGLSSRLEILNSIMTKNAPSEDQRKLEIALYFAKAAIAQLQQAVRELSPNPIDKETGIWDWEKLLANPFPSERKASGKRKSMGRLSGAKAKPAHPRHAKRRVRNKRNGADAGI